MGLMDGAKDVQPEKAHNVRAKFTRSRREALVTRRTAMWEERPTQTET